MAKVERIRKPTMRQLEKDSVAWFTSLIKAAGGSALEKQRLGMDVFKPARDPFIGGMFFYLYDPKHKEKLPWWDAFPLVIPVENYSDGFLGLNLHYLPPPARKKLIEGLLKYKKMPGTPNAYMKLSYSMLKAARSIKEFEPCIHRYLFSHVKSQFIKVDDSAWVKATMLPVQQFAGAHSRTVWKS